LRIVVNGRFSQYKTGVGRVIENYLLHLAKIDRRNAYYIYMNEEFADAMDFGNERFQVVSNGVPAGDAVRNHLWTQTGLVRAVRQHHADVLLLPQINLVLRKPARIILFQHDLIEWYLPNQKPHKLLFRRFAFPRAIQLADRIICVSHNTQRDVHRFFPQARGKTEVIPSGVNREHLRPVDRTEATRYVREKFDLPDGYILYVGTLTEPQKNLVRLVEAHHSVLRQNPAVPLVLAGARGKDAQLIDRRIAELGSGAMVRQLGYVDDADLPYLFAAAGVFCFPSLYEGFGLPVLEAMACGCPVVTSNTSSLPQVAGDAAWLVDPTDTTRIAEALLGVLNDAARRRQMIRKGLANVERFSWDAAARRLLEVIESVGSADMGRDA